MKKILIATGFGLLLVGAVVAIAVTALDGSSSHGIEATAGDGSEEPTLTDSLPETAGVTLSIADVNGEPHLGGSSGEQLQVEIVAKGTAEVAGMQFRLEYDKVVMEIPPGGVAQGDLPSDFLFQVNLNDSEGYVDIVFAGARALNLPEVTIAQVTFDLTGSAGGGAVFFRNVIAADASIPPQPVPVTAVDGIISIGPSE